MRRAAYWLVVALFGTRKGSRGTLDICNLCVARAQFTSFATAAGETLPRVLPEVVESLAPLVAWDNLLAV